MGGFGFAAKRTRVSRNQTEGRSGSTGTTDGSGSHLKLSIADPRYHSGVFPGLQRSNAALRGGVFVYVCQACRSRQQLRRSGKEWGNGRKEEWENLAVPHSSFLIP